MFTTPNKYKFVALLNALTDVDIFVTLK